MRFQSFFQHFFSHPTKYFEIKIDCNRYHGQMILWSNRLRWQVSDSAERIFFLISIENSTERWIYLQERCISEVDIPKRSSTHKVDLFWRKIKLRDGTIYKLNLFTQKIYLQGEYTYMVDLPVRWISSLTRSTELIWMSHPKKSTEFQFSFEFIGFGNRRTDLHQKMCVLSLVYVQHT